MAGSGIRKVLAGCGGLAVAVILAACSSGTSHLNASPTTTAEPRTSSTAGAAAAKKHAATKAAKKRAAAVQAKKVAAKKGSNAGTTTGSTGGASGTTSRSRLSITVSTDTTIASRYEWQVVDGNTVPRTTPPTTAPGPKPFDPNKPIDLSGTPGVTPAEQARAEQLVRDTLRDLPRYANPATAYADGYRSIGDAITGSEHYVKWAYIDDGRILDSKYPESLVYQKRNGQKTLVSAMYMLWIGARFTDVPDVGGPLTQWHIHSNLCLVDNPADPLQKVVGSLTGTDGSCPPGSTKAATSPMLHVWIVSNPCGPFAALEGISAGEVPEGQTRQCDTAHGSH